MKPLKTFIIYAHEDSEYKNELLKFLRVLERQSKIEIWSDGKITPGSKWDQSIKENLNAADIILPLISIDFSDSNYIQEVEFKTAIERMDKGETKVVPILTKTCNWESFSIIKDLQVLPSNSKPIEEWPSRNASFTDIVKKIEELVNLMHEERSRLENEKLQAENQAINRKFLEEKAARRAAETEKATAERAKEEARKAKEDTELLLEETEKAKFQLIKSKLEAEIAREDAMKLRVAADVALMEAVAAREATNKELDQTKVEKERVTKRYQFARFWAYSLLATLTTLLFAGFFIYQSYITKQKEIESSMSQSEMGSKNERSKERIETLLLERSKMRDELLKVNRLALNKAYKIYLEDNEKYDGSDIVAAMKQAKQFLLDTGLPPYETPETIQAELDRINFRKTKE